MVLRYFIGGYMIARGGAYLVEGSLVFARGVQNSVVDVFAASMMFIGALFLLFAGTGLSMGHFWSVNFSIVLLGVDVLATAGSMVVSIAQGAISLSFSLAPLDVAWFVGSLLFVTLLVFTDPLAEKERPDIDENESVHGMTSFRN